MPVTHTSGTVVHWEARGTGTPLLLVMGLGFTSASWWPVVDHLAARHRVLTFDNRGLGASGAPAPTSMQCMVDDALAVLDAAGCPSAHVYGVSMGGGIALELAVREPRRVASLVLGCTMAKTSPSRPPSAWPLLVERLLPGAVRDRLSARSLYGTSAPRDRVLRDQRVLAQSRRPLATVVAQARATAAYATAETDVRSVAVPALVLHGTADRVVPYAEGRRLAELTGARLVTFEGAGHNYLVDHAEESGSEVLDFLATVDEAGRTQVQRLSAVPAGLPR